MWTSHFFNIVKTFVEGLLKLLEHSVFTPMSKVAIYMTLLPDWTVSASVCQLDMVFWDTDSYSLLWARKPHIRFHGHTALLTAAKCFINTWSRRETCENSPPCGKSTEWKAGKWCVCTSLLTLFLKNSFCTPILGLFNTIHLYNKVQTWSYLKFTAYSSRWEGQSFA